MENEFTVNEMMAMQRSMLEKYKEWWEDLTPESGKHHLLWMLGEAGEVIDVMEIPVATAEIVSVQTKLSYARVIEGDASQVTVGARLRRIPVPAAGPAADIPVTTTIKSNGQGGVVVPF